MYKGLSKIHTLCWVFFLCELQSVQKLVLHFDVNKTIIATDRVQNKGLEESVNSILAKNMYYTWNGIDHESYYAYATKKLMASNPKLSPVSEEFKLKRSELITGFFVGPYPQFWCEYVQSKKRILKLLSADELVVFPSFFKLINWLEAEFKDRYVIYLRTFGTDLPEIMPIIEKNTSLRFAGLAAFDGRYLAVASEYSSLTDFFYASNQHYGIQDDYAFWQASAFTVVGAKLFPVDPYNKEIISMFFDDNANDSVKPIISPMFPNGELLDTQELIRSGHIVPVNTKEAILNTNYFIEKVREMVGS